MVLARFRGAEPPPAKTGRAGYNDIWQGRLLQRAQIYTWPREQKLSWLRGRGITGIVNFWPKADTDLVDMEQLHWYWQISSARSEAMLEPRVVEAAGYLASYLRADPRRVALVLCEAGKTRSVFFSVLVLAKLEGLKYPEALARVQKAVPSSSLKGFHLEWLRDQ